MADKLILSLYFGEHDSCITISDQEKILLHLEAERIFRIKHYRVSPLQMEELVVAGLAYLNKKISNIESVLLASWGGYDFSLETIKLIGRNFYPIITSHHANHIGTCVPAGFDDSLIVCADGGSEDGSTKIYLKKKNRVSVLADLSETILTGKFYGTLTQIVIDPDFSKAHNHSPGKAMGLAALGKFSQELCDLILTHQHELSSLYPNGCQHLNHLLSISMNYDKVWLDKRRCNLAFTAQKIWQEKFLEEISKYKDLAPNVCLVGGCALNVTLNSALAEKRWFRKIYVTPVSGDSGQSLGAIVCRIPNIKCDYPFLGRGFGEVEENKHLTDMVTRDLLEGKIVAWYQGRSEIGARALGHRSFFGLPNSIEMRRKLSEQVKGREPYRPVAALLAEEFLPQFTADQTLSPFMTFAPKVFEDIKKNIPAIVHFDGTSRTQTLKKSDNSILHDILIKVGEKTGYPVLMNSSFNIAGEPIVDTPEDAQVTFRRSRADVLYTNGKRYEKA